MPIAPIPFINALQSGDEELEGASPQALNVIRDGAGAVRRRPGIGPYFTVDPEFGAPTGLYVNEFGQKFAVVPRGSEGTQVADVYRFEPTGRDHLGTRVCAGRPTFAETEMLLVIAAGNAVGKIEIPKSDLVEDLGGDPPFATHIARNDLRLLGNDAVVDRAMVRFSSVALGTVTYEGHEDWTLGSGGTAGFFPASASPDNIVALTENTNEIWAFGTKTLQLFVPDPSQAVTDSARFSSAVAMEVGCTAPYSVVKKEGGFYWLDHARRFVRSEGRGTEVLSKGLHRVIQNLSKVDDCFGYSVLQGPLDAVVWTFPKEGRTFCVQAGAGFSEWTSYDEPRNQHVPFAVTAHAYHHGTGQNLVGAPGIGVGQLISDAPTDVINAQGDQRPIVAEVTTGFLNRDTDARKHCRRIRLTFRWGHGPRKPEVKGYITYRDALGPWEPPIPVVIDGMEPVCEIASLGVYRRRQWRYSFGGDGESLVLAGAEEDYAVEG